MKTHKFFFPLALGCMALANACASPSAGSATGDDNLTEPAAAGFEGVYVTGLKTLVKIPGNIPAPDTLVLEISEADGTYRRAVAKKMGCVGDLAKVDIAIEVGAANVSREGYQAADGSLELTPKGSDRATVDTYFTSDSPNEVAFGSARSQYGEWGDDYWFESNLPLKRASASFEDALAQVVARTCTP